MIKRQIQKLFFPNKKRLKEAKMCIALSDSIETILLDDNNNEYKFEVQKIGRMEFQGTWMYNGKNGEINIGCAEIPYWGQTIAQRRFEPVHMIDNDTLSITWNLS